MAAKMTADELDPMHAALAAHFMDILTNGEVVEVKDRETGEVSHVRVPPSAAMMNQIRQFLKDNGVEAAATSKRVRNLAAVLPFAGTPEEGSERVVG